MRSAPTRIRLPFALPPGSKVAHVSTLPEIDGAQAFARGNWQQLGSFQPNALIGYGYDLARLAGAGEGGEIARPSLDRAIYVLTDCGMPPLSDALRQHLWSTFGVPVYELIIAPGCILLAAECESHSGWHLQPGVAAYLTDGEIVYDFQRVKAVHTGFRGELEMTPCECGRQSPRLRDLMPYVRRANEPAALLRAS